MKKIYVTPNEVEIVNKIIEENDIKGAFELIYDDSSGIGYTLDLEFETQVNGRYATIRIPVTTAENW
jgi:hypothetical protein